MEDFPERPNILDALFNPDNFKKFKGDGYLAVYVNRMVSGNQTSLSMSLGEICQHDLSLGQTISPLKRRYCVTVAFGRMPAIRPPDEFIQLVIENGLESAGQDYARKMYVVLDGKIQKMAEEKVKFGGS